jgi:hypothetical protein
MCSASGRCCLGWVGLEHLSHTRTDLTATDVYQLSSACSHATRCNAPAPTPPCDQRRRPCWQHAKAAATCCARGRAAEEAANSKIAKKPHSFFLLVLLRWPREDGHTHVTNGRPLASLQQLSIRRCSSKATSPARHARIHSHAHAHAHVRMPTHSPPPTQQYQPLFGCVPFGTPSHTASNALHTHSASRARKSGRSVSSR